MQNTKLLLYGATVTRRDCRTKYECAKHPTAVVVPLGCPGTQMNIMIAEDVVDVAVGLLLIVR